ncbi:MAG: Cytochrome c-type biogenesis protein DsbD, protein-disulfide reductase (EC [uncultured Campylobacterales bacterium]|uniref:Cytochrome c-type biogenesis protein DsbD, protein-disulfide reductase (EC) n=1 Tax=uncultured Campylobacterales bacterium TaxID=352960 RepID=A0A6S6T9Y2_9BACT|nr:MAG: Cytochrome c-type biogenesis protein DsbD, protein-disulfide reductase (EC [uncultured Campylobacterales bacterium]
MKKLILILGLMLSVFAYEVKGDFVSVKDAFKVSHEESEKSLDFKIDIAKNIYLYGDSIKLLKDGEEVDIKLPKTTKYETFDVYFDELNIGVNNPKNGLYTLKYQGCAKSGFCYPPKKYEIEIKSAKTESSDNLFSSLFSTNDQDVLDTLKGFFSDYGYVYSLLLFLLIGALLSLTPCIFPIVPILSSILVSNSKGMTGKKGFLLSFIYVLGMAFAYAIVGAIAGTWGFSVQGSFQNPWVLSIFSIIFVLLSLSLFGLYEIKLPASLQTKLSKKSDEASNKGGFLGTFVMGFLSALIVGACTGPVVAGAFLLVSFLNDPIFGAIGFFFMGFGVGLPLLVVGLGFGKFMPKPGGWMSVISKIFGLVLLGVAIIMISRILSFQATMILWGVLALVSSFVFFKFRNIVSKIISGLFLVYGLVIFYGAVNGAVSPLAPFVKFEDNSSWDNVSSIKELKSYNAQKPILLNFTADWCIYCKELEVNTFAKPEISALMEQFELIKIDLTSMDEGKYELMDVFEVSGPPAIIFFDVNKNELKSSRVSGYIEADDFAPILKDILEK